MTKNFNTLFNEIASMIEEDIKSDIEAREAQNIGSARDERGYEDVTTIFDEPGYQSGNTPAFDEVSVKIDGAMIKKYGYDKVFNTATAKYGMNPEEMPKEVEIGQEDADGIEAEYMRVIKGDTEAITKVENGTFQVIVPKELYASDTYPTSFKYQGVEMQKTRTMHHKPSGNVIIVYIPLNIAEDTGKKAYNLLIKMIADTITASPFYAMLSNQEVFEANYGLEAVDELSIQPMTEAGVDPSKFGVLKHILRFSYPTKSKGIDTSVTIRMAGLVNLDVILRAMTTNAELREAMQKVAEQVNDMLKEMFGDSSDKFYTIDQHRKNFSKQYLGRAKSKLSYKAKAKARDEAGNEESEEETPAETQAVQPPV